MGIGMWLGIGFGFGGLLFWGFANRDVKVDWLYVLFCAVVMLALGLHNVVLGFSSHVNNGPWDIFVIGRGCEQHFLTRA